MSPLVTQGRAALAACPPATQRPLRKAFHGLDTAPPRAPRLPADPPEGCPLASIAAARGKAGRGCRPCRGRFCHHRCAGAKLSHHAEPAGHCRAGGPGWRGRGRSGARRARSVHRQVGRHAVGHLQAVSQEPVALARTVGHEPAGHPQSAPDLPGPAAGTRQERGPGTAAPGAGRRCCGHRRRGGPQRAAHPHGAAVAARARADAGRCGDPAHQVVADRAFPGRATDR